jgi:metallo-beta-lactamase family protein
MKLTFYGAAGQVTGSKTLIETGGRRFLLDCGLFHGEFSERRNREEFPFDIKSIDAVILTHAHLDHIGLLPRLVKVGYGGPVFATEPTRELCRYMWEDAAKIQAEETDAADGPLYDLDDIEHTRKLLRGSDYGESVRIAPNVDIVFRDAGHILGSAFVEIYAEGRVLVGSGDIGNDDVPILNNTVPLKRADAVILESTYGNRTHESAEGRAQMLKQAVKDAVARRSVLLVPAFSLERTQEILYEMNAMVENGEVPELPVFLDSPLATDILPVFRAHPECYDREAITLKSAGDDFFRFPSLKITRRFRESMSIDKVHAPKVIIAGSGMMSGGRIVRHLGRYLQDKKNILFVIGYQALGTRGRQIVEGAKTVMIEDVEVPVAADVRNIDSYSAHGDRDKLLRWIGTAHEAPKMVFCNHGEPDQAEALAEAIRSGGHAADAIMPKEGVKYDI